MVLVDLVLESISCVCVCCISMLQLGEPEGNRQSAPVDFSDR